MWFCQSNTETIAAFQLAKAQFQRRSQLKHDTDMLKIMINHNRLNPESRHLKDLSMLSKKITQAIENIKQSSSSIKNSTVRLTTDLLSTFSGISSELEKTAQTLSFLEDSVKQSLCTKCDSSSKLAELKKTLASKQKLYEQNLLAINKLKKIEAGCLVRSRRLLERRKHKERLANYSLSTNDSFVLQHKKSLSGSISFPIIDFPIDEMKSCSKPFKPSSVSERLSTLNSKLNLKFILASKLQSIKSRIEQKALCIESTL